MSQLCRWVRYSSLGVYIGVLGRHEKSVLVLAFFLSKLVVILTTSPNFAGAYGMVVPDAVEMAWCYLKGPSRRPADLRTPTAPALSATSHSGSP